MIRTFKVGDPYPDLLHQGTFLPLGAKVTTSSDRRSFEQLAPGVWRSDLTGDFLHPYFTHLPFRLNFLPDGQEEVRLPGESTGAYLWRIRDAALSAAERSGVHLRPVEELAESIGATEPRFELGHLVGSAHDALKLPQGSLLYTGDPSYPKHFTVYKVRDRRLVKMLGPDERQGGEPFTLYSAPGNLPAIPTEPEASEIDLAKLALKTWRLGKVWKRRQNWCGVFDTALDALGINDASIAATGETSKVVGDMVSRDQAALLPERTLLGWVSSRDPHRWVVFRRDNRHTRNTSRTVRVLGRDGETLNSTPNMLIIKLPNERMQWQVGGSVLQGMPRGTRYTAIRDGNEVHELDPDRPPHAWYHYRIVDLPGVA